MGIGGELLCSYSSNHEEFWVSLIEKAYMKVSYFVYYIYNICIYNIYVCVYIIYIY